MYRLFYFSLLFCVVIAGCSPYTVRSIDQPTIPLPDAYHHGATGERPISHWWQEFGDPKLNTAMEVAFTENFDLRQAWSRLTQAHAQAKICLLYTSDAADE